MKRYFIALSVIGLAFLTSCHFSSRTFGTQSGSQINSDERNKIFAKSEKIYRAIKQGNVGVFKEMAFEDAKKYFGRFTTADLANYSVDAKANDLRMEAEYLVANNGLSKTESVTSENYTFRFPLVTTEAYIALFSIPTTVDKSRALVSTVYIKDKGEWKLLCISVGTYTFENKTAPQYFETVKSAYAKGNLIEAALRMQILLGIASPSNEMLVYNDLDQMKALKDKLAAETKEKFKFPINVAFGGDYGTISDITVVQMSKVFPLVAIEMKTLVPVERLKTEMTELNTHIEKYLPGIGNGADSIVYYIATKTAEQSATTQVILPAQHS